MSSSNKIRIAPIGIREYQKNISDRMKQSAGHELREKVNCKGWVIDEWVIGEVDQLMLEAWLKCDRTEGGRMKKMTGKMRKNAKQLGILNVSRKALALRIARQKQLLKVKQVQLRSLEKRARFEKVNQEWRIFPKRKMQSPQRMATRK